MTRLAMLPQDLPKRFSGGVGLASDQIAERLGLAMSALSTSATTTAQRQDTLEHRLFDARATCKITTSQIAMHFDDQWRRGLFRQLDTLIDFENWEEDELPPNPNSFLTLLRMVLLLKPHRRPGLGATSTGNFVATWTIENAHLTIECKLTDHLRWFVSRAGETAGGQTTLGRLRAVLAPYNPETWFEKARAEEDPR